METVKAKEIIEYFLHKYNLPYTIDNEYNLFNIFDSFDFYIQFTDPDDEVQGCKYGFVIWDETSGIVPDSFLDIIDKCNLKKLQSQKDGDNYIIASAQLVIDAPPHAKSDYSKKKEIFDKICEVICKDLIDALNDLKTIASYTARDITKFRVGNLYSQKYVSVDDTLTILQGQPDEGILIKDAWKRIINETKYFTYNGKSADYVILYDQPHIEIQGLILNALFITQTKENEYLLLGRQNKKGISVDMLKITDDGLSPIANNEEFQKANIFLQEAGEFMSFLSSLPNND